MVAGLAGSGDGRGRGGELRDARAFSRTKKGGGGGRCSRFVVAQRGFRIVVRVLKTPGRGCVMVCCRGRKGAWSERGRGGGRCADDREQSRAREGCETGRRSCVPIGASAGGRVLRQVAREQRSVRACAGRREIEGSVRSERQGGRRGRGARVRLGAVPSWIALSLVNCIALRPATRLEACMLSLTRPPSCRPSSTTISHPACSLPAKQQPTADPAWDPHADVRPSSVSPAYTAS